MNYTWKYKDSGDPELVKQLAADLNVSELLASLLTQRGVTTFEQAKAFFRPSLDQLHDPFLMRGMQAAVDRIRNAYFEAGSILVYGDYDVDGTSAVALVYSYLKSELHEPLYYIPDRYTEGYGLSLKGIDYAKANNCSLIIALDCGIKAIEQVTYANSLGIDVIICDHHLPGNELPAAHAILNPKQHDCPYPYKELCGCGIGFKLVQALAGDRPVDALRIYLDLVAVATAADIVPLTGENRTLVHFGLQQLRTQPRHGYQVLMELAGSPQKRLTVSDVVFQLGPRINAAGRLDHGKHAVALLTSHDDETVREKAAMVHGSNTDRQEIDRTITREALDMIAEDATLAAAHSTVLFNQDWHKGVVGIVASRVIESHYRPTVILTESEGLATGSARSIKGFDLYAAIEQCSDLLERWGGHHYAAGLSLKVENIPAFRERFEAVAAERLNAAVLTPTLQVDARVELSDITPKFFRILKQFAPFGPGNRSPVFQTDGLQDTGRSRTVGTDGDHLKLDLIQPWTNRTISGIAFKLGDRFAELATGKPASMLYCLEENEWNGNVSIQMRVKDMKFQDT